MYRRYILVVGVTGGGDEGLTRVGDFKFIIPIPKIRFDRRGRDEALNTVNIELAAIPKSPAVAVGLGISRKLDVDSV